MAVSAISLAAHRLAHAREPGGDADASDTAIPHELFEHLPVALWVEDFSGVRRLLEGVRAGGADIRMLVDAHPDFVHRCQQEVRVLAVNRPALSLYAASDQPTLLQRLAATFRDDAGHQFRDRLLALWTGEPGRGREAVRRALDGRVLHVLEQQALLPGSEHDWARVLTVQTDITARKQAEAYLEFLGRHDSLTRLWNRAHFADEMARLERGGPFPVSVIVIDLNGLKSANDLYGHSAGDALLRRAGAVLGGAVREADCAARIGGDEFALLLPSADAGGADKVMARIAARVAADNEVHPGLELSLAMGAATAYRGEAVEEACRRADAAMYGTKRAHYARQRWTAECAD